jgi:archaellum biogenesis ATPase FlaH
MDKLTYSIIEDSINQIDRYMNRLHELVKYEPSIIINSNPYRIKSNIQSLTYLIGDISTEVIKKSAIIKGLLDD